MQNNNQFETLSEAVRRLSKEIENEPNNPKLYFERGMAYFKHENWFNAEDDFSQAIELDGNNADYYAQRGHAFFKIKKWEEALTDYERVLDFDENNIDILHLLGIAYGETEDHHNAIRNYNKAISLNPKHADLYSLRGKSWMQMWYYGDGRNEYLESAIKDFSMAITLCPDNVEFYTERATAYSWKDDYKSALDDYYKIATLINTVDSFEEYKKIEFEMSEKSQRNKSLDERIAPYLEKIQCLKENSQKLIGEVTKYEKERVELIATLALLEEYELLKNILDQRDQYKHENWLNNHVRSDFAWWQPSPLYFITGKNQWTRMKDPSKMICFLVSYDADPHFPAGDGSTLLWNQTNNSASLEIMETLLKIGTNPNQISIEDTNNEMLPLINCLLPFPDETKAKDCLPYDSVQIQKAKLLLQYGANPNMDCSALPSYTPLLMAIIFGRGFENLELIKLLIEKGADVNVALAESGSSVLHQAVIFSEDTYESDDKLASMQVLELLLQHGANVNAVDNEGNTPLMQAIDFDLFEVGQLLLLHGATMPKQTKPIKNLENTQWQLEATEDCFFRPGGGSPWDSAKIFTKEDVFSSDKNTLEKGFFKIEFSNKTLQSLEGRIIFEFQGLVLDGGTFSIDLEKGYSTPHLNVAYDTHLSLSIRLVEVGAIRNIAGLLEKIKEETTLPPPANEACINVCNAELKKEKFPELPKDFADFLLKMNGFAYNSVEIYGTATIRFPLENFVLNDIVSESIVFRSAYGKRVGMNLLCFGRENGDYYTYNPVTKKYQARSHECITDIWDEYDGFEEFLLTEVVKFL